MWPGPVYRDLFEAAAPLKDRTDMFSAHIFVNLKKAEDCVAGLAVLFAFAKLTPRQYFELLVEHVFKQFKVPFFVLKSALRMRADEILSRPVSREFRNALPTFKHAAEKNVSRLRES